jgi:hypothetical protein
MTAALKAMVEAMGAEFERQAAHSATTYAAFDPTGDGRALTVGEDGGLFDLEKVARAGLEAIDGADKQVDLTTCTPEGVWGEVLDAILKEHP